MTESKLVASLLDNLQESLLESGKGLFFESRQKRIAVDRQHFDLGLLFYYRILMCHVQIDLKIGKFSHIDAGQMNCYLNYVKGDEIIAADNPSLGVVLCARKNKADVKYATAGINNKALFLSIRFS